MNPDSTRPPLDLLVVMPVYNEEACIERVVRSWLTVLRRATPRFLLLALNDGSTDGTSGVLHSLSEPDLQVVDKVNEGHGPTILRGYATGVQMAEWVFQTDSDDELPPEPFLDLWARRAALDMAFGVRQNRQQHPARRLISAGSRLCVRALCGRGVSDVNVPYRLMRSSSLRPMLEVIPPKTFAPNVVIAGLAIRAGLRICNVPVPFRGRRTGKPSLVKWSLLRNSARSLVQTVRILHHRGAPRG